MLFITRSFIISFRFLSTWKTIFEKFFYEKSLFHFKKITTSKKFKCFFKSSSFFKNQRVLNKFIDFEKSLSIFFRWVRKKVHWFKKRFIKLEKSSSNSKIISPILKKFINPEKKFIDLEKINHRIWKMLVQF